MARSTILPEDRPLSAKDIKFAKLYVATGNRTRSYIDAYNPKSTSYEGNRVNAYKKAAKPNVAKYIEQLRDDVKTEATLSVVEHCGMLEELRDEARENGQMTAAITAEVNRGKVHGLYIERLVTGDMHFVISDDPVSDDEWEKQYGQGMESTTGSTESTH